MSFYYKGSTNNNDEFYFQADSDKYDLTGNEWQYFEMPLAAGKHLLLWRFARKSGADEGSASIDLIKLPPMHVDFDDVDELSEISNTICVYPNPGRNELNIIYTEESSSKLQVFDFQGRLLLEKDIYNGMTTINTANWPSGLYFWKVGNEAGKWIKSE